MFIAVTLILKECDLGLLYMLSVMRKVLLWIGVI